MFSLILIGKDLLVNNLSNSYHSKFLLKYRQEKAAGEKWTSRDYSRTQGAAMLAAMPGCLIKGCSVHSLSPIPINNPLTKTNCYMTSSPCNWGQAPDEVFAGNLTPLLSFLVHRSENPQIFMECPPWAGHRAVRVGRALPWDTYALWRETDLDEEKQICHLRQRESLKREEWAGVTERGDWSGKILSYRVVVGEPGEEHSGKKRQSRNVGDEERGLGAGLSWAGGGVEPSSSVLSSSLPSSSSSSNPTPPNPHLSPSPSHAQAYGIPFRQPLGLYLPNS